MIKVIERKKMIEEQLNEELPVQHGHTIQLSGGYTATLYRTFLRDDLVGIKRIKDALEAILFIPRGIYGKVVNMQERGEQLVMITEGGPYDCRNTGQSYGLDYKIFLQSFKVGQLAPECYGVY